MTNNRFVSYIKNKFNNIKDNFSDERKKVVLENKISHIFTTLIRGLIIFGLSFIVLFPLFQQLSLAFREPGDLNNPLVIFIPDNWTWLNIKIASSMLDYQHAVINNFKVASVVMIFQILVTSVTGYAFARLKFPGSGLLFILVLATIMIPPQTLSLNRYLFFKDFGIPKIFSINLLGNRGSLYMMTALGMGINSGLFIYIFRQFFRNVPIELEESAQVDGASVIRTFWSVMLPNARPAMLTVGLFSFVWQWNDVYYTRLLSLSSEKFPLLPMRLANAADNIYQALFYEGALNLVGEDVLKNPFYFSLVSNTAAFLMMLPVLIIFIFLQRYFVESIERTGIVG
ncbi:carbohydrate ABC transporter permease [Mycoplasmatota bacterium]|nr:carbohydrate ABC transporter permease [Mycoplasmatota bacterium]